MIRIKLLIIRDGEDERFMELVFALEIKRSNARCNLKPKSPYTALALRFLPPG